MDKLKWHQYRVTDGKGFKLSQYPTSANGKEPDKDSLHALLSKYKDDISAWQNKLYAESRQSLLIILQGMDSAGKDGTISHIMSGVNPQGVEVVSFKHPSSLELSHDYLWRHFIKLPEKGQITIFNRSHYENVLISMVHPEIVLAERIPGIDTIGRVNKHFWRQRYEQIVNFEQVVVDNGTQILKFFLHLSKEEQRRRFMERIDNKEKHWKFSSDDISERAYWSDYQRAYEKAVTHTSSKALPWHVIPADDKWYTHLLIGNIILDKLRDMSPQFPKVGKTEEIMMQKAKGQLEKEG